MRQPHALGRKVSEEYIVPRQPAPSPRPAQLRRRGLMVVRVSIDPLRIVLELWGAPAGRHRSRQGRRESAQGSGRAGGVIGMATACHKRA